MAIALDVVVDPRQANTTVDKLRAKIASLSQDKDLKLKISTADSKKKVDEIEAATRKIKENSKGIKVDLNARGATADVRTLNKELDKVKQSGKQSINLSTANLASVSGQLASYSKSVSDISSSTEKAASVTSTFTNNLVKVIAVAGGAAGLATLSDVITNIDSKLKIVTSEAITFANAFKDVRTIALNTRTPIADVATLFSKMAASSKDLGASQAEVARVTQNIAKSIAISGATSAEARSAILQLGQGLASGVLAGEELRAVLESAPALAQAIADGLGRSRGELKKMGEDGKLNTIDVFKAILSQTAAIDANFKKMNVTFSQATTNMQNAGILLAKAFGDILFGSEGGLAATINSAAISIAKFAGNLKFFLTTLYIDTVMLLTDIVEFIRGIPDAVKGMAASFKAYVSSINVRDIFKGLKIDGILPSEEKVAKWGANIKETFASVKGALGTVGEWFSGFFDNIGDNLRSGFDKTVKAFKSFIADVKRRMSGDDYERISTPGRRMSDMDTGRRGFGMQGVNSGLRNVQLYRTPPPDQVVDFSGNIVETTLKLIAATLGAVFALLLKAYSYIQSSLAKAFAWFLTTDLGKHFTKFTADLVKWWNTSNSLLVHNLKQFLGIRDKVRYVYPWKDGQFRQSDNEGFIAKGPKRQDPVRVPGHDQFNALPFNLQMPVFLGLSTIVGLALDKMAKAFVPIFGDKLPMLTFGIYSTALLVYMSKIMDKAVIEDFGKTWVNRLRDWLDIGVKALFGEKIFGNSGPFGVILTFGKLAIMFESGRKVLLDLAKNIIAFPQNFAGTTVNRGLLGTLEKKLGTSNADVDRLTRVAPGAEKALFKELQENQRSITRLTAQLGANPSAQIGITSNRARNAEIQAQLADISRYTAAQRTAIGAQLANTTRIRDSLNTEVTALRQNIRDSSDAFKNGVKTMFATSGSIVGGFAGYQIGIEIVKGMTNASEWDKFGVQISAMLIGQGLGAFVAAVMAQITILVGGLLAGVATQITTFISATVFPSIMRIITASVLPALAAIVLSPLGAAMIAIAAIVLAIKNWDGIKVVVENLYTKLKELWKNVGDKIDELIKTLDPSRKKLQEAVGAGENLVPGVPVTKGEAIVAGGGIAGGLLASLMLFKTQITSGMGSFSAQFVQLFKDLAWGIPYLWNEVNAVLKSSLMTSIGNMMRQVATSLGGVFTATAVVAAAVVGAKVAVAAAIGGLIAYALYKAFVEGSVKPSPQIPIAPPTPTAPSLVDGVPMATGGQVRGPGTGTSDSIPAYLSNGEFVVNAQATARNRAILESINSGNIPRFSEGGLMNATYLQNAGYVEKNYAPERVSFDINNLANVISEARTKGLTISDTDALYLLKNALVESHSSYGVDQSLHRSGRGKGTYFANGKFWNEYIRLSDMTKLNETQKNRKKTLEAISVILSGAGEIEHGGISGNNYRGADSLRLDKNVAGRISNIDPSFLIGDDKKTSYFKDFDVERLRPIADALDLGMALYRIKSAEGDIWNYSPTSASDPERGYIAAAFQKMHYKNAGSLTEMFKSGLYNGKGNVYNADGTLAASSSRHANRLEALDIKENAQLFADFLVASTPAVPVIPGLDTASEDPETRRSLIDAFFERTSLNTKDIPAAFVGLLMKIIRKMMSDPVEGYASGGMIRGPGSAVSDSIPAYLSNGEFVVNAKATKRNRELLTAINSGINPVGFAGGTDHKSMAYWSAKKYGIPPEIFMGMIQQESGFNPNAVSPDGARGIGQFMPETWKGMGQSADKIHDAALGLDMAAKHLRENFEKEGSWVGAIGRYHGGPKWNMDKRDNKGQGTSTGDHIKAVLGNSKGYANYQPSMTVSEAAQAAVRKSDDAIAQVQQEKDGFFTKIMKEMESIGKKFGVPVERIKELFAPMFARKTEAKIDNIFATMLKEMSFEESVEAVNHALNDKANDLKVSSSVEALTKLGLTEVEAITQSLSEYLHIRDLLNKYAKAEAAYALDSSKVAKEAFEKARDALNEAGGRRRAEYRVKEERNRIESALNGQPLPKLETQEDTRGSFDKLMDSGGKTFVERVKDELGGIQDKGFQKTLADFTELSIKDSDPAKFTQLIDLLNKRGKLQASAAEPNISNWTRSRRNDLVKQAENELTNIVTTMVNSTLMNLKFAPGTSPENRAIGQQFATSFQSQLVASASEAFRGNRNFFEGVNSVVRTSVGFFADSIIQTSVAAFAKEFMSKSIIDTLLSKTMASQSQVFGNIGGAIGSIFNVKKKPVEAGKMKEETGGFTLFDGAFGFIGDVFSNIKEMLFGDAEKKPGSAPVIPDADKITHDKLTQINESVKQISIGTPAGVRSSSGSLDKTDGSVSLEEAQVDTRIAVEDTGDVQTFAVKDNTVVTEKGFSDSVQGLLGVSQAVNKLGTGLFGISGSGSSDNPFSMINSAVGFVKTTTDSFNFLSNLLPTAATGGLISGPGTGTSDSIMAMLSNGEFIVNAKSSKKYGALLSAINSDGLPKFADGGIAGSMQGLPSINRSDIGRSMDDERKQQVFNLNITGDVSRQTKKEIMSMLPQIANGVNMHNREISYRGR
jgi:tape measure domain-containing protein